MFRKFRIRTPWRVYVLVLSLSVGFLFVTRDFMFYGGGTFFCLLILEIYFRLKNEFWLVGQHYKQIEALFSVHRFLPLIAPLPSLRGWAISPDFISVLVQYFHRNRPKFILDLGSGVSTLVCGYLLKNQGEGQVIGVEHRKDFLCSTEDLLDNHGLKEFASVIYSPLCSHGLLDKQWQWYDTSSLALKDRPKIDMLIVDGPPDSLQELSRYPALPLLEKHLSDKVVILLDDALGRDEREIVSLWAKQFPDFSIVKKATEKGTIVLSRG